MAAVLVLGGGWVGSAVARSAGRTGPVTVVDPPLDPVLAPRDRDAVRALRELLRSTGATSVVNACGRVAGPRDELEDANVGFPRWLCGALDGTGVRLVHVGSASEYGDPGTPDPVDEDHPRSPVGDYATTKAVGSDVVEAAAAAGLDAVVARVFNLVDVGLPPTSPLQQWLDDLRALPAAGGTIEVWWPPTVRDFVRLADAADALVSLAGAEHVPGVVNVCSGVGLAFGDIVGALADRLGRRATVVSLDRPGIPAVVGDPTRLRGVLGSVPAMDLDLLAATVVPAGVLPEGTAPEGAPPEGAPPEGTGDPHP